MVVSSRGASYDPGSPTEGWDHAVPVLELILGTALGMSVEVITTSLTLAETVPPGPQLTAAAPSCRRPRGRRRRGPPPSHRRPRSDTAWETAHLSPRQSLAGACRAAAA